MNDFIFPDLLNNTSISQNIKKGTLLINYGDTSDKLFYVEKGCLRSYVIDNKGKEHILQFAPENWIISDTSSFEENQKAVYYVDAIEDSVVRVLKKPGTKDLAGIENEALLHFLVKLQKRNSVLQKRITQLLSATAEERYMDFNATYPNLSQRLPQYMIASYLGITAESLSRVRKEMYSKKSK